jgi:recombination protein RecA
MLTAQEISKRLKDFKVAAGDNLEPVELKSTGSLALDYLCGGGVPLGRIIEIYGATHTTKSLLTLTLANAIATDGFIYIVDSENSIDEDYLRRAGVDPAKAIILQTASINKALAFYHTILSQPDQYRPAAFIFDTVKGLQPETALSKIEENPEAALMASAARVWSAQHGVLVDLAREANVAVFCVNHVMTNLSPYASPVSKPGGNTIPQIASLSLHIKGKGKKPSEDLSKMPPDYPVIMSVEIECMKSRFCAFGRQATIDLLPTGYDLLIQIIRLGKQAGIINGTAGRYSIELDGVEEPFKAHGLPALYSALQTDMELRIKLETQIRNALNLTLN